MRPPIERGRGSGARSTSQNFGRGGNGSGRGRGRGNITRDLTPETIIEMGKFLHSCEGEAICELTQSKVPFFNAPIFRANKTQVGKVEEIFGPISKVMVTIKLLEGVQASSCAIGDSFHISPDKLLPLERFLPQHTSSTNGKKRKTSTISQERGPGRGRGQGRGRGRGRSHGRSSFSKRL